MHDEELAACGVGSHGTGHGKNAFCVLQVIFYTVLGEFSFNGVTGAAGSVTNRVAALDHKAFDDSVENQPVIEILIDQTDKVIYGNRGDFRIKLCLYNISVFHGDCYNGILCHK